MTPTGRRRCCGADIDTRNVASIALVESLGFVRVWATPNADVLRGESSDEVRYELRRLTEGSARGRSAL